VLGDVVEALIGAIYMDGGLGAATTFIRRAWGERVSTRDKAPKHPKSALQEWAAAHDKKPPHYQLAGRSGPHLHRALLSMSKSGGLERQAPKGFRNRKQRRPRPRRFWRNWIDD
jgi:ribonuclease-3